MEKIGALYGFPLGTYDCTELGWLEGSTEGTEGVNLEGVLLGYWLGLVDGIELGTKLEALDGL